MLVQKMGNGLRQCRRLVTWPRWVRSWRDDHQQRSAARGQARAHAPIRLGERLLTVACETGGKLSAATDCALYHQTGLGWARLGWDQVGRVDWDEQRHVLVLAGLTPAVPAHTVLRLARAWDLPAVAAERVGWAKVVDERISLVGAAGARVIARRIPGGPPVTWLVILDHGLDPRDSGVRARLGSALAEMRAVTGLDAAGSEAGIGPPRLGPGSGALRATFDGDQATGDLAVARPLGEAWHLHRLPPDSGPDDHDSAAPTTAARQNHPRVAPSHRILTKSQLAQLATRPVPARQAPLSPR